MDPITIGIVTLRFLAQFATQLGRPKDATGLNALASAAKAGVNVDDHMKHVASQLEAGNPIDWDDVDARIRAASDRLHGRASASGSAAGGDPERVETGIATETIRTRTP